MCIFTKYKSPRASVRLSADGLAVATRRGRSESVQLQYFEMYYNPQLLVLFLSTTDLPHDELFSKLAIKPQNKISLN